MPAAARLSTWLRTAVSVLCALSLVLCQLSCGKTDSSQGPSKQIVLYTSVDEPYVKPILAEFESRTGIKVLVQTDTEATKSAGLAERLEAERDNPRADVWWGNEVFHTIRLADAGVLAPYDSPAAKGVPDKYKDGTGHRWAGCGLRARVIASHRSEAKRYPTPPAGTLDDLLKPEYRGKVGMARPTAGTTGGHVAALYVLWGRDRFVQYFQQLKANDVKLLGGNGPVAEAVGRGELLVGLTDNDDVASVQREGGRIASALLDQDSTGTLAVPTTVALVTGSRNEDAAKKLVDYLLSPEVEDKLIAAHFAGWSVRDAAGGSGAIKTMNVDFHDVAQALPTAVQTAMTVLEGRDK